MTARPVMTTLVSELIRRARDQRNALCWITTPDHSSVVDIFREDDTGSGAIYTRPNPDGQRMFLGWIAVSQSARDVLTRRH